MIPYEGDRAGYVKLCKECEQGSVNVWKMTRGSYGLSTLADVVAQQTSVRGKTGCIRAEQIEAALDFVDTAIFHGAFASKLSANCISSAACPDSDFIVYIGLTYPQLCQTVKDGSKTIFAIVHWCDTQI